MTTLRAIVADRSGGSVFKISLCLMIGAFLSLAYMTWLLLISSASLCAPLLSIVGIVEKFLRPIKRVFRQVRAREVLLKVGIY